jgi:hypothetical protein
VLELVVCCNAATGGQCQPLARTQGHVSQPSVVAGIPKPDGGRYSATGWAVKPAPGLTTRSLLMEELL